MHLTLQEYKDSCKLFMENFYMELGAFNNMLIVTNKKTSEAFTQNTMSVFQKALKIIDREEKNLGGDIAWCAIRYTVKTKNLDTGEEFLQNTMEFVKFKDNPDPICARVVESWALSDLSIG